MKNEERNNNQSRLNSEVKTTNPKKVKEEIQKDLRAGQGDITSREAGSFRG